MRHTLLSRLALAGLAAAALIAFASSAHAQQTGRVVGVVVDESNTPVPDIVVRIEFIGDYDLSYEVKTNSKGEFARAGLAPGRWRLTATKDKLKGTLVTSVALTPSPNVTVMLHTPVEAAKIAEASKLSADQIEKHNKEQQALKDAFDAAGASIAAGNTDDALAKLNDIVVKVPDCAACYAKIGDLQVTKKDNAAAEAAYQKAVTIDPTLSDVYAALATVYNGEGKLDDAAKMSAKAAELNAAKGGGGDATSLYNQGIILWNQGKGDDAKACFDKAVAADPKFADAYYMQGLILVGQTKNADAIKALNKYLELAPTGQNAETAKAILASIKGSGRA